MATLPAKYEGIDFKPPKAVREECARGVAWVEDGKGGDGLKPETIAWARKMAEGQPVSPEKIRLMPDWFARHEVDKKGEGWAPDEDGYPSDGRVAWALWGGDAGRSWATKIEKQMDAADARQKEAKKAMTELTTETAPEVAKAALGPIALQFWCDTCNSLVRAGMGENQAMMRAWDMLYTVGFYRAPDGTYLRDERWEEHQARMEEWYTPGEGMAKKAESVEKAGKVLSADNAKMLRAVASGMSSHIGQIKKFLQDCGYGEEGGETEVEDAVKATPEMYRAVVIKAEPTERIAGGWWNVCTDDQGRRVVDSENWHFPIDVLRKGVADYIQHGDRTINEDHLPANKGSCTGVICIDEDTREALGLPRKGKTGIFGYARIEDAETWDRVVKGKQGWSVEGTCILTPERAGG